MPSGVPAAGSPTTSVSLVYQLTAAPLRTAMVSSVVWLLEASRRTGVATRGLDGSRRGANVAAKYRGTFWVATIHRLTHGQRSPDWDLPYVTHEWAATVPCVVRGWRMRPSPVTVLGVASAQSPVSARVCCIAALRRRGCGRWCWIRR